MAKMKVSSHKAISLIIMKCTAVGVEQINKAER